MIAAEVMTENPKTIKSSDAIGDAIETLQAMEVRHLPVVDDDANLVGMLSDRDLGPLMRRFAERPDADRDVLRLSLNPVSDYMTGDVVYVDPDTDVTEVIDVMLANRIGAVPVVDAEGDVVGIISYVDVLRALGEQLESAQIRVGRPRGRPTP
jgi:acetoin utilization protein AcuB